jgi:hypothetical protein
MPRTSKRKKWIVEMKKIFLHRMAAKFQRELFDDLDDPEFIMAEALDCAVAVAIVNASNKRYLFRVYKYRKGKSKELFDKDICEGPEAESDDTSHSVERRPRQPWLNDVEFLQKYSVILAARAWQTSFFLTPPLCLPQNFE